MVAGQAAAVGDAHHGGARQLASQQFVEPRLDRFIEGAEVASVEKDPARATQQDAGGRPGAAVRRATARGPSRGGPRAARRAPARWTLSSAACKRASGVGRFTERLAKGSGRQVGLLGQEQAIGFGRHLQRTAAVRPESGERTQQGALCRSRGATDEVCSPGDRLRLPSVPMTLPSGRRVSRSSILRFVRPGAPLNPAARGLGRGWPRWLPRNRSGGRWSRTIRRGWHRRPRTSWWHPAPVEGLGRLHQAAQFDSPRNGAARRQKGKTTANWP